VSAPGLALAAMVPAGVPQKPPTCIPAGPCFADGTWLWISLGVGLALALAFALDFTRRRRLLDRIGHAPQLRKMAESLAGGRRVFKAMLLVFGVTCVALSLAHPQIEGQSIWRQRGIDVAVVMDFSKSMLALDARPSRIARARLEADTLIDNLSGDRVAVVAFAGGSVHYPLTTDYDAAKILYAGISPMDMAPGSDLAGAITTARCLLRPDLSKDEACERVGGRGHGGDPLDEAEARKMQQRRLEETDLGDRARAIVVITDGEQTEGDALDAARQAAAQGIAVFVVGVGTPQGAPVPEYDEDGNQRGWKTDEDGQTVMSRLDEPGLKELAKAGGGEDHYYRLHVGRLGMEPIIQALGRLKEGDLQSRVQKQPQEAYQWLLFPGFFALVLEACLSDRRRRAARAAAPARKAVKS
jgi:Ca-activated chloride channel family protein